MRKLFSLLFALLFSIPVFAQSERNLVDYSVQVKESDSGYAIIVGDGDLIGSDYWKTRVDIGIKETVDEAINRLGKLHFVIKASTVENGKQTVFMTIKVDPRAIETYLNEMFKIADELDKIMLDIIDIDYDND